MFPDRVARGSCLWWGDHYFRQLVWDCGWVFCAVCTIKSSAVSPPKSFSLVASFGFIGRALQIGTRQLGAGSISSLMRGHGLVTFVYSTFTSSDIFAPMLLTIELGMPGYKVSALHPSYEWLVATTPGFRVVTGRGTS